MMYTIRITGISFASALTLLSGLMTLGACTQEPTTTPGPERDKQVDAVAELRSSQGDLVADASFEQLVGGLALALDVYDLPAGEHGFHIHEVGNCSAIDFSSAGGHFNPNGATHGLDSEAGSHVGDLPNIAIDTTGKGQVRLLIPGVTLLEDDTGRPSLLAGNGTALVVHIGPDDYRSDPAGAAGTRIACGVIQAP